MIGERSWIPFDIPTLERVVTIVIAVVTVAYVLT